MQYKVTFLTGIVYYEGGEKVSRELLDIENSTITTQLVSIHPQTSDIDDKKLREKINNT